MQIASLVSSNQSTTLASLCFSRQAHGLTYHQGSPQHPPLLIGCILGASPRADSNAKAISSGSVDIQIPPQLPQASEDDDRASQEERDALRARVADLQAQVQEARELAEARAVEVARLWEEAEDMDARLQASRCLMFNVQREVVMGAGYFVLL